jgi:hypothetical protein
MFPGFRQIDPLSPYIYQFDPELKFQSPYLLRDSRLGNAKLLRGQAKTGFLGYKKKCHYVLWVDVWKPHKKKV